VSQADAAEFVARVYQASGMDPMWMLLGALGWDRPRPGRDDA
jgi:hypothetical protein